MKIALITGITGQDGSYLAELLLDKGYEVHGLVRSASTFNRSRIDPLLRNEKINSRFFLHYGDMVDTSSIRRILEITKPAEIYNLAAQSHVKVSFDVPDYTAQVDGLGTLRFLDAIREEGLTKSIRFYQASTSELFGKVQEVPQRETTPFYPRSPYATSKLFGFWTIKNYREAYGLFASNGILFNHESPRRGENFVTRKITLSAVRIFLGLQDQLVVGNIEAKRDWGYAPEYVEGMWKMLQYERGDDFVLATGEAHSVREFIELAFKELGLDLVWRKRKDGEEGVINSINECHYSRFMRNILPQRVVVKVSSIYFRPTEVDYLVGDASKAKKLLDWNSKTKFSDLIKLMIKSDFLALSTLSL